MHVGHRVGRALFATTMIGALVGAVDAHADDTIGHLDIEAGRIEADTKLQTIVLDEEVVLRVGTLVLRAHRLKITRRGLRVHLEGDGVVALCGCDAPLVGFGFTGAWLASADDLIVASPTMRIAGVPVLWLPYLWLRGPREIGLTLPQIALRGHDGVLLEEGVHIPIGGARSNDALELRAGGYTAGGVTLAAIVAMDVTAGEIRFDRGRVDAPLGDGARSSGVAADLVVDVGDALDQGAAFRSRIDVVRGARALDTTLSLDPRARPWDRAEAIVDLGIVSIDGGTVGVRGGDLRTVDAGWGSMSVGGARALGDVGAWSVRAVSGVWQQGTSIRIWSSSAHGDLAVAAPVGPFVLRASAIADGNLARLDDATRASDGRDQSIVGEASVEAALPLARLWRSIDRVREGDVTVEERASTIHLLEPHVRGDVVVGAASGPTLETPWRTWMIEGETVEHALLAAVGIRSTLARTFAAAREHGASRSLFDVDGSIGLLEGGGATARGVAAMSIDAAHRPDEGVAIDARLAGAVARHVATSNDVVDDGPSTSWVLGARGRIAGADGGAALSLRGVARGSIDLVGARALLGGDLAPALRDPTWLAGSGAWGSAGGATIGGALDIPFGHGWSAGIEVEAFGRRVRDFTPDGDGVVTATRGHVMLDDPCGCMRVGVVGGTIAGRHGVDVALTLEIAPHPRKKT